MLLDSLPGHELINSGQATHDKLVVKLNKTVAKDFCDARPNILENTAEKISACKDLRVAANVDADFEVFS